MWDTDQGCEEIARALEVVRSIADTVTISLVANLKSSGTEAGNYSVSSVATEYFSENEVTQILLGLQECGFYTKLYAGEIEFINAV